MLLFGSPLMSTSPKRHLSIFVIFIIISLLFNLLFPTSPAMASIGSIGTSLENATLLGITGSVTGQGQGIKAYFWSSTLHSHFYKFTVPAGSRTFYLDAPDQSWPSCHYSLRLYNSSGSWLKNSSGYPFTCNSWLDYTYPSGTFFMEVTFDTVRVGPYRLLWEYDGSTSSKALQVQFSESGDALEGYNYSRSVDWYWDYLGDGNTSWEFKLDCEESADFDLHVFDENDLINPIASSSNYWCPETVRFTTRNFNRYYFEVSRFSGTGDYRLLLIQEIDTPVLTVSKSGTGTGTVTSSPAGITCGGWCSSTFYIDQTVTLSASPNTGSIFSGWTGEGCEASTGTCTVYMTQSRSVTATFTEEIVNYPTYLPAIFSQ